MFLEIYCSHGNEVRQKVTQPSNATKVPLGPNEYPFWSVVVPVYRPALHHLKEALESVLRQDPGKDKMHIEVVDDCSPGLDVRAIVQAISPDRVQFSQTPKNLGLAGCWNTCVERAKGRWVHVLHQDDRVAIGFYARLQDLIRAYPSAGAAFCRSDYIDADSKVFLDEWVLQPEAGILVGGVETLAKKNVVKCPAIVVRRDVYDKLGTFDARFSFTLDWEMWVRVASGYPVLYCPEALASFRIQTGSETSRLARTGETVRDCARFIQSLERYLPPAQLRAIQAAASVWVSELAVHDAEQFVARGLTHCAMAQLQALLQFNGSRWAWKRAMKLWLRAVSRDKKIIMPPLPFLPATWFREPAA